MTFREQLDSPVFEGGRVSFDSLPKMRQTLMIVGTALLPRRCALVAGAGRASRGGLYAAASNVAQFPSELLAAQPIRRVE